MNAPETKMTAPPSQVRKVVTVPEMFPDLIAKHAHAGRFVHYDEKDSPWVPFGEAVPRCFGDGVERPVLGAQRASRGGFGGRSVHGTRTGGLRGERGGGHFGRG